MNFTKTGRFALSAGAAAVVAGSLLGAPLAASAAEGDPLDITVTPASTEWANGDEQIITIAATNNSDVFGIVDFTVETRGISTTWDQSLTGHTSVPITATVDGADVPVTFSGNIVKHVTVDVPAGKTAIVSAPIIMKTWTLDPHTETFAVTESALTDPVGVSIAGSCQVGNESGCSTSWTLDQIFASELTLDSTPATGGTVQPGDSITYSLEARTHLYNENEFVVAAADLSGLFANATLVEGSLTSTSGAASIDADDRLNWTTDKLDPARLGDNGRGDPATATFEVTVNDDAPVGSALTVIAGGYGDHPLFVPRVIEAAMDPETGVITPTAAATSTLTVVSGDVVPAPSIAVVAVADQVSTVGDDVSVQVEASSTDGSALTYSAAGLPEGVSIDATTGLILGAPTAAGDYTVTVSASSDTVAAVETTFAWTVNAADVDAPSIAVVAVADQVSTVGDEVSVQVEASSTDGSAVAYTASGLPEGVSIDATTGLISGAPTTAGDYTVTVSASSDTVAAVETTFAWTVNAAAEVDAPSIAVVAVADQVSTVGDDVSVQVEASSTDGSALTYSAAGLPEGVSIDATTGLILGAPTAAGDYTVTVSASSDTVAAVETTFAWTVNAADVDAPSIAVVAVADQVSTVGDEVSVQVEASSTDGSAVAYTASGLPEGVSIDATTGLISGAPTTAGDYTVTVSASSDTVAAVETTFAWTVNAKATPTPNPTTPPVDDIDTTPAGNGDAQSPTTGASVHTGGVVDAEAGSAAPWFAAGAALLMLLAAAGGVLGIRRVRGQKS